MEPSELEKVVMMSESLAGQEMGEEEEDEEVGLEEDEDEDGVWGMEVDEVDEIEVGVVLAVALRGPINDRLLVTSEAARALVEGGRVVKSLENQNIQYNGRTVPKPRINVRGIVFSI